MLYLQVIRSLVSKERVFNFKFISMKKLFLLFAAVVVSLTAGAQMYVGGEAGFWREWQKGANMTDFSIKPEVGYNLNENWAIGMAFGYEYEYWDGKKMNTFEVAPYVRYTYAKLGPVNLFLDGGFGFSTFKIKEKGVSSDAQNAWSVGLKPGLSVNLTEKLSFIAHFGSLGYSDADGNNGFGRNGFGFNVNGNNLLFGMLYNF